MWYEKAHQLVKQANITQQELKVVFGVNSRAAVGHYLTGRRQPRPEQIKALADFLGVRIDDFFSPVSGKSDDAQALKARLKAQADHAPALGRRYDWSNPGGLSEQTLCLKVLQAGRYADMLALARQSGLELLQRTVESSKELSANPYLMRKLNNLRRGLHRNPEAGDHAV